MMHKNFMHRNLRIFVVQCLCMKFYALCYTVGMKKPLIYAALRARF